MTRREVIRKWERLKRKIIASAASDEEREFFQEMLDDVKPPANTKEAEQWLDQWFEECVKEA